MCCVFAVHTPEQQKHSTSQLQHNQGGFLSSKSKECPGAAEAKSREGEYGRKEYSKSTGSKGRPWAANTLDKIKSYAW